MAKGKKAPVEKNEFYMIEIEDLNIDGDGVGKIEGFTLFVPGTVPGDKAHIKVINLKKGFGYGRLETIIRPSQDRCESQCPVSNQCGGCQLHHINYPAQLSFKKRIVEQAFKRIGKFEGLQVNDTIGMENQYNYRNKAQYPIGDTLKGETIAGFYAKRSHRIVPIKSCIIQNQKNDEIVQRVLDFMNKFKVPAYNEEKHQGYIRHIVTRYSKANDYIQIIIVTNSKKLPNEQQLVESLSAISKVEGILINTNTEKTNVILGKEFRVLFGKAHIYDNIGELSYRISPNSFFQINPEQTEKLYNKVLEFASLTGNETIWDIYCGIGTISFFLAKQAKKVYGVEVVKEAIMDADFNAKHNNISNTEFFVGKAEEVILEKFKQGISADIVVLDPPRKGCEPILLETLLEMQPNKIIYVSCDPATLARDAKILAEGGYVVEKVQPVDMFGFSVHVESIILMTNCGQKEK